MAPPMKVLPAHRLSYMIEIWYTNVTPHDAEKKPMGPVTQTQQEVGHFNFTVPFWQFRYTFVNFS